MARTPDFAAPVFDQIDVVNEVGTIGAGSFSGGPHALPDRTGLLLGLKASVGDIDAAFVLTGATVTNAPDYRPVASVGVGETLWLGLPNRTYGQLRYTITGDAAGTIYGLYGRAFSGVPPSGGEGDTSPLAFSAVTAVAAGATLAQRLAAYAGRASVNLVLPGASWGVLIESEDRAANVVAQPLRRTTFAGDDTFEVWLPPRINVLRLTNNTGAPANAAFTVMPTIEGRY